MIRARLAELGAAARRVLADVDGWLVVEEVDEPSAITTLAPIDGATRRRSGSGYSSSAGS